MRHICVSVLANEPKLIEIQIFARINQIGRILVSLLVFASEEIFDKWLLVSLLLSLIAAASLCQILPLLDKCVHSAYCVIMEEIYPHIVKFLHRKLLDVSVKSFNLLKL